MLWTNLFIDKLILSQWYLLLLKVYKGLSTNSIFYNSLFSFSEIKFAKEISDISKKRGVQLNWRTLAQKCSVPITSRFEYQKSGSISIHNRVYAFTMDKCVLKRITSPPMGDEEKCLIILSLWLKNLPTTHHVTSLIPLLKNNVNYLTGNIVFINERPMGIISLLNI